MNANGSQVTASNSYAINQAASSTPKLTITDDTVSSVGTGVSVNFTFQFDQAVTGFDASDIVVTNGGIKGPLIQLDAKTWVMSVNTPNFGAGEMIVSVVNGSFFATTGGTSGIGASQMQAYDASLTKYLFNQFGNGITGNAATPIYSGASDDQISAIGKMGDGVELIDTGAGNDILQIFDANIPKLALASGNASFNGGTGIDTLQLFADPILDLTNVNVANNLKNFETLEIKGVGNNIVKLDLNAVLNMSDIADNLATTANEGSMLVLNGDTGDTVQLVGGINWTTVTTGVTGASLNTTYGAAYNFGAADTYRHLTYNGASLFIDEAMARTNL
jgi:hypothetical protein